MQDKPKTSLLSNLLNLIRLPFFSGSLNKYRLLLSLISALMLLAVLVLGLSMWTTNQMLAHTKTVDIATRQGILVQQISKNVIDIDLYLKEANNLGQFMGADTIALSNLPANSITRMKEIPQYAMQFESNLQAFEKGGKILTPEGLEVNIVALPNQSPARDALQKIRQNWTNYQNLINLLVQDSKTGSLKVQNINNLVNYVRQYNQTMLVDGNQLTFALYDEINKKAHSWQTLQLAGMVLAFVLFAAIAFGAMRRLIAADTQLKNANEELGEIMSAIREGLFLVEKDFTIGKQHSAPLEEMLGQTDIKGKNFLDVIAPMLPESELVNTQMFIEQLYNPWVVEDLIEDLNPLHRIAVFSEQSLSPKYLDFKFFRVFKDEKVERILVSVIDSTESVVLESSLQAQEEQEEREMEMLNAILHVDSRILNNFIVNSQARLDEINQTLQSPETGLNELKAKASFVARNIHTLKGEASAMNLSRMVDICCTVEDSLAMLRRQNSLSGQDFFAIVVLLEDLYRLLDILRSYENRLEPKNEQPEEQSIQSTILLENQQLQTYTQDMAERNGKKISLLMQGFQEYEMDSAQRKTLHEILMQLVRNSVVHGIEYPSVRRKRNKSETGIIKFILTATDNGQLNLLAEDDGNGIDFEAIRNKAVAEGRYTVEEVGQLSKKQLLSLMLSDGFSTAAQNTEDAGKGVGMGVIRQSIQKMGGKFNINTAYEQYTRFTISFPPKQP